MLGLGGLFVSWAAFQIDWGWLTAAWAQAIGSIIAILAAIYIGHRNHKHSERIFEKTVHREDIERRLKARSLAIALYPELVELDGRASGMWREKAVKLDILKIPPVLRESIERLYLLGEVGAPIQQAVAISRSFNRIVEDCLATKAEREEKIRKASETLPDLLEALQRQLNEALKLIGPIHDSPVTWPK